MNTLNTYYITFGQIYRGTNDPLGRHPDGWMEIRAENMDSARDGAFKILEERWSHIYDENTIVKEFYPLGCLKVLN